MSENNNIMKSGFLSTEQTRTPFLLLNTRKCIACWKCIAVCPNNVINKVNFPWHKHALIENGRKCTGCLKCLAVCESNALYKLLNIDKNRINVNSASKFIINLSLLLIGSLMIFSGFLIQFEYHMGNQGEIDANHSVLRIYYSGWSAIHKISIVLLSVLMIFHINQHWKWYTTVIRKKLAAKNKQVITLTIVFLLVAISGYISWFIHLSGGSELIRKIFIEIHDKLTLVLTLYLILHLVKRFKWFTVTFSSLMKR